MSETLETPASGTAGSEQPQKTTMDIVEIMAILPHRYPFLLIDRVIDMERKVRIVAIKKTQLTPERAGQFYAVHSARPFYNDLFTYMSSGTIVPMILEKENAVADFRKLIGATNPAQAEEGTIRKLYAKSIEANAIHGSDSDENATIEGSFFFAGTEQY